jgi:hypothetical protein
VADIGTTTRIGIRRQGLGPRVDASGPTPGAPPIGSGLYSRSQATASTADFRSTVVRSNPNADDLLTSPAPPSFGAFSPIAGAVARTAAVTVTVSDASGLDSVLVWGVLSDGTIEMVYDGAAISSAFDTGSSVSGSSVSKIVVVQRDSPGWAADYTIHVAATNSLRRSSSASSQYTLTNPPAAPTVGPFSPISGGTTTRTAAITIDVTDDEGSAALALVTISATLSDGRVLTAYDGAAFAGPFSTESARSDVSNGYRYSLVHDGAGWPTSTLAFRILAIDAQGRSTVNTTYTLTISDVQTGPSFGGFSPPAGVVARADGIEFTVTDPDGFAAINVWAVLGDGSTVVVYDGSSFGAPVDAGSSVSGTTTKSFSVVYDGDGWPDDYILYVRAVDSLGVSAITSAAYTLSDPPPPLDITPPIVANFVPAPATTIARGGAIEFDVTDDIGLALIDIKVLYTNGDKEVAFDEEGFSSRFAAKSTKTAITGGWHFKLIRTGGWPAAPTIKVRPIDGGLNQG